MTILMKQSSFILIRVFFGGALLLASWCLPFSPLSAQVDTVYICNPGDPAQLSAPAGYAAYFWSPARGLDNPTIVNPIARPQENQTYVVRIVTAFNGENLIENGDFSDGDIGFTSDYPYNDVINFQGVYGVNESAANLNPTYFSDCPDHTNGQGKMMVVDGSPIPDQEVWCQNIDVVPDTRYAFTAWLTSVNPNNPAELQFSINGAAIGAVFRASNTVCQWRQFYEVWESDTTTQAEICIINQNTNPQGNDFALDDFAFQELSDIIFDTVQVIVEAIEAASERRIYFPNAFSPNYDGRNDVFLPLVGKGVASLLELTIYDRWGSIIYTREDCDPTDRSCGWDGQVGGRDMPAGTYTYLARYFFRDRTIGLYSGNIMLLR